MIFRFRAQFLFLKYAYRNTKETIIWVKPGLTRVDNFFIQAYPFQYSIQEINYPACWIIWSIWQGFEKLGFTIEIFIQITWEITEHLRFENQKLGHEDDPKDDHNITNWINSCGGSHGHLKNFVDFVWAVWKYFCKYTVFGSSVLPYCVRRRTFWGT